MIIKSEMTPDLMDEDETPQPPTTDTMTAASLPLSQREKHPILWFNDGTVIIATPKMLFRVYRGILSFHSAVFRKILSQPQTTASETLNGLSVYHLPDDPSDLSHLLRALHDSL